MQFAKKTIIFSKQIVNEKLSKKIRRRKIKKICDNHCFCHKLKLKTF